jgi:hypothetical protein
MALDHTTNSKSFSVGVSHDLRENLQWTGDMNVSQIEGTVDSFGVAGSERVSPDYSVLSQLIASSVFKTDDSVITGVGFTNSDQSYNYSFNFYVRYPLTKKLRLSPKLNFSYQPQKTSSDYRVTVRPLLHLDIFLTKSTNLEIEGGSEWVNETSAGVKQSSREQFATIGYRIIF